MRMSIIERQMGRSRLGLVVGPIVLLWITAAARAAPPVDPLLPPQYSFDLASPKVGLGTVGAGDVLELALPDPIVRIPGSTQRLLGQTRPRNPRGMPDIGSTTPSVGST